MQYADFLAGINGYYERYGAGLKKQANAHMKAWMSDLRSNTSAREQEEILVKFCTGLCDTGDLHWMRERGNGQLPYELHNWLRDTLYPYCVQNRMPYLRWYYELYRNDKIGHEIAAELLLRAYHHEECDGRTVELVMKYWLNMLGFGAHHFPTVCCIQEEDYQQAMEHCLEILENHDVAPVLRSTVAYYRKLYGAWERYERSDREVDFLVCCEHEGIEFEGAPMFF